MPRLRTADLAHRRHGDASVEIAADDVVLGGACDGDAFQRHVGATIGGPTRRHLQDGWLLAQKLRRSMVDPDRDLLEGVVEVDQTEIPSVPAMRSSSPGPPAKSWSPAQSK
jgi:hypothetical protein